MAMTAILAGPGDFLPVIFVLIAIASGIVNFIKERKAAAAREDIKAGGWKGGDADRELRSEIDVFLQEVSPDDSSTSRPPRQSASQQQRRKKAIPDEEAERRRQLRARRERRQKKDNQQRSSASRRKTGTRDREEVSSRHIESSVENRHLHPHIVSASDSDLLSQRDSPEREASRIATLLHQPAGIRNAILLSEILGPPVSQRPGHLKRQQR